MADIYPSTRRFAHHSLLDILDDWPRPREVAPVRSRLEGFDFMADEGPREAARTAAREAWRDLDKAAWPDPPAGSGVNDEFLLPASVRRPLVELGRRHDKQISIGE